MRWLVAFWLPVGSAVEVCQSRAGHFCANHCEGSDHFESASLELCQKQCLESSSCTGGYWHPNHEGHTAVCKLYGSNISKHQCCDEEPHWEVTRTFTCRKVPACAQSQSRPSTSPTCEGPLQGSLPTDVPLICAVVLVVTVTFCLACWCWTVTMQHKPQQRDLRTGGDEEDQEDTPPTFVVPPLQMVVVQGWPVVDLGQACCTTTTGRPVQDSELIRTLAQEGS